MKLKDIFLADGKMNRKNFALIILIYITLEIINFYIGNKGYDNYIYSNITYVIFFLMYYIITCSVIKRFHDIHKSGWYLLGLLVPIYNIYLAILLFSKSGVDNNKSIIKAKKPLNKKLIISVVGCIVIGVMCMVGYEGYKANKAVEIVKKSNVEDKEKTTDDVVEAWMEEAKPNKIYGWNGKRVDKDTYFVTYEFDDDEDVKNGTIIVGGYEVNIKNKTVKSIIGDKDLENKYIELGFIN